MSAYGNFARSYSPCGFCHQLFANDSPYYPYYPQHLIHSFFPCFCPRDAIRAAHPQTRERSMSVAVPVAVVGDSVGEMIITTTTTKPLPPLPPSHDDAEGRDDAAVDSLSLSLGWHKKHWRSGRDRLSSLRLLLPDEALSLWNGIKNTMNSSRLFQE